MEGQRLDNWQERIESEQHDIRRQLVEVGSQVSSLTASVRSLASSVESIGAEFKNFRDKIDDRNRPDYKSYAAIGTSVLALFLWLATLGNEPLKVQLSEQRQALARDIEYADTIAKLRDDHSNEMDKLLDNALQQEMRALIRVNKAHIDALQRQVERHQDRNHEKPDSEIIHKHMPVK